MKKYAAKFKITKTAANAYEATCTIKTQAATATGRGYCPNSAVFSGIARKIAKKRALTDAVLAAYGIKYL